MNYLARIPLTRKVLAVSFFLCAAIWGILDQYQTVKLRRLFNEQLNSNLQAQAIEDRAYFNTYIRSFGMAGRIIVSQKRINNYLITPQWLKPKQELVTHQRSSPWLPRTSILRSLPFTQYFLLLNQEGAVREICKTIPGELPGPLMAPNNLLRQLSHNQTYLTKVNQYPYLITSETMHNDAGGLVATLMLVTPLDNEFLYQSLHATRRNSLVAFVDNNSGAIIASNKPEIITPGTLEEDLKGSYLITGKSYFDYGSSDLQVHFISLLSQQQYDLLSKNIMKTDRIDRAVTSLALIFCLISIISFITWKINKLKEKMDSFALDKLGAKPHLGRQTRDQLHILGERFEDLKNEIMASQEKLQSEADKNILLTKKNMEMEEQQHLLKLLQAVTEEFEIGVIVKEADHYYAANKKMEQFAASFGGINTFTKLSSQTEHSIQDSGGENHFFQVNKPVLREVTAPIILVQEVTDRKRAEYEREKLIQELRQALGKVKLLSGFLPICASCKKIRDDKGYWNQIELYIRDHSEAEFSHGICPDCCKKLYSDLDICAGEPD